jgi:CRP-like cAMP-binding protein
VRILHAILFPVNLFRLLQSQRLIRDIRNAHREDLPIQSLPAYMTKREFAAINFGNTLSPGSFLGEIGVFVRGQQRTATVVSRTDCSFYDLSERKAKQLFFHDKLFGSAIMQLIIDRRWKTISCSYRLAGLEASNALCHISFNNTSAPIFGRLACDASRPGEW